jgi:hypothetical protein
VSDQQQPPRAYLPGRYVISWAGAGLARDPIALTSQVKTMRLGFERAGHRPALVIVVVADDEVEDAVDLITKCLDAVRG